MLFYACPYKFSVSTKGFTKLLKNLPKTACYKAVAYLRSPTLPPRGSGTPAHPAQYPTSISQEMESLTSTLKQNKAFST